MRAYDPGKIGCYAGWRRYEKNRIIGEQIGEVSDTMVLPIKDRFHLYYSHRFLKKILVAVGENGLDFRPFAEDGVTEEKTESKAYVIGDTFYSDGGDFGYSLIRRPELKWEAAVCQPFVLFAKGKYHLFYTGKRYDPVTDGYDRSVIGHATGNNAMNWMASRQPVLEPDLLWERNAVCYPCVIWDEKEDLFKMWYSAGDIEKPLAIGYAVSRDGEHWEKPYSEPVLKKDNSVLEKERVGACHVLRDGEQYVMFYTAWQDAFKSRICLARSEDGICWERHPNNPIITGGQFGAWDVEAVCRPAAVHLKNKWICYYTGCARKNHRIGALIHEGDDLGFCGGPK
mgnify:FL=1